MIATATEYQKAQAELQLLEGRLLHLQEDKEPSSHGFAKAGVRKMIARLHEELAICEGGEEARRPETS
jgi:hypothetical protein